MKCPRCNYQPTTLSTHYCPKCGADMPFDCLVNREGFTNTYALTGFVLACASLFFDFLGILTIIAIVLSVKGLKQIKETGEKGRALAIAGIIISCLGFVLVLIAVVLLITLGYMLIP